MQILGPSIKSIIFRRPAESTGDSDGAHSGGELARGATDPARPTKSTADGSDLRGVGAGCASSADPGDAESSLYIGMKLPPKNGASIAHTTKESWRCTTHILRIYT